MKIDKIIRKLHKNFMIEAAKLGTEAEILDSEFKSIIQYKSIIRKVINDYNFKGRYFKVEFLPAILAMVIDEYKNTHKEIVKEIRKTNILAEACLAADIKHF